MIVTPQDAHELGLAEDSSDADIVSAISMRLAAVFAEKTECELYRFAEEVASRAGYPCNSGQRNCPHSPNAGADFDRSTLPCEKKLDSSLYPATFCWLDCLKQDSEAQETDPLTFKEIYHA
jgi:hypothetical protein